MTLLVLACLLTGTLSCCGCECLYRIIEEECGQKGCTI